MAEACIFPGHVDEDGGLMPETTEYETFGSFETVEEAARAANERDFDGEGRVAVQRWSEPLGWENARYYDACDLGLSSYAA